MQDLINATATITAAILKREEFPIKGVEDIIGLVFDTLYRAAHGEHAAGAQSASRESPKLPLGVRTKDLVQDEMVVCAACGFRGKMLRSHLRKRHGLTPDAYRAQFNLPADFPLVSRSYSKVRSKLAHASGLGKPRITPPKARRR